MQILPDYQAASSVRMLSIVTKVRATRKGSPGAGKLEGEVRRSAVGEGKERNLSAAPMGESSSF